MLVEKAEPMEGREPGKMPRVRCEASDLLEASEAAPIALEAAWISGRRYCRPHNSGTAIRRVPLVELTDSELSAAASPFAQTLASVESPFGFIGRSLG